MEGTEIGKRFKLVRKHLNLTLKEIAEKTQLSTLQLHRIEYGIGSFNVYTKVLAFYANHINLNSLFMDDFQINIIQERDLLKLAESIIAHAIKDYQEKDEKNMAKLIDAISKSIKLLK